MLVYVGLGSNLNHPVQQLQSALFALANTSAITISQVSSFYRSRPLGGLIQPDYINAVVELITSLSPEQLLAVLQMIEVSQGRQRHQHWGARTLDLDLLLCDKVQCNKPNLILPHPGIYERDFVLIPLAEIAPNFLLPNGMLIQHAINACPSNELTKLDLVTIAY